MLASEVFRHIDAVVGKSVTLSGYIAVSIEDGAFLTADFDAWDRKEAILVRDEGRIGRHLLQVLAVYVGGPFSYFDECVVTGTVDRADHGLELRDLRRCTVTRDGMEIEVPVGGPSGSR